MTNKLTNTEMLKVLADALKKAQDDIEVLEKGLRLVNLKLKKYENKTIGGFNAYVSPKDIGYKNEDDY